MPMTSFGPAFGGSLLARAGAQPVSQPLRLLPRAGDWLIMRPFLVVWRVKLQCMTMLHHSENAESDALI